MNKAVKALIASGIIGVSGLLVASKFTGDQAIEDAKSYVKDSYSLLEKYDMKQKSLKEDIKILETELADSNKNNEELNSQLEELQGELEKIEVEKEELLDRIAELEEQIANGGTASESLTVELEKANSEILRANTKIKELEDLIKEKDLSKFNPNGETEYPIITKEIEISKNDLTGEQSFPVNDGYVKAFGKHYRYDSFLVSFTHEVSESRVEVKGLYKDGTVSNFGTYITSGTSLIFGGKFIDSNGDLIQSVECKFLNSQFEVDKIVKYNFNWIK